METENRTILILFSVVVLLVFLDHQSDRQLRLAGLEKVERISAEDLTESISDEARRLDRLHRPAIEREVKRRVRNGLEDATDTVRDGAEDVSEEALDQAEELAGELDQEARRLVKRGLNQALDKAKLKLKEVSLEESVVEDVPVLPVIRKGNSLQTRMTLYFPGFKGRKTVMMRVKRTVEGTVDPLRALEILQAGPTAREIGLVNAFDQGIKIKRLSIHGGLARVELSESVHRMSAPVRQDRLDQLCLTLFQFPEIKAIQIYVDGKPIQRLGTGKDAIPLRQPLRRIDRKVEEYKPLP